MDFWPERDLTAALPKSMPETARLSAFEKENGKALCTRHAISAQRPDLAFLPVLILRESKRAFCVYEEIC